MFFTDHVNHKTVNNLQNLPRKFLPAMTTLVEQLFNFYDYFFRLSGFFYFSAKNF